MGGGTLVEELVVELPAFLNQVVFIHELLEREFIRVQQGLDGTGLCKAQAPKHDCRSWKTLQWHTQRRSDDNYTGRSYDRRCHRRTPR